MSQQLEMRGFNLIFSPELSDFAIQKLTEWVGDIPGLYMRIENKRELDVVFFYSSFPQSREKYDFFATKMLEMDNWSFLQLEMQFWDKWVEHESKR